MKQKFKVTGMTCSACQSHVDKSVRKLDGVIDVNVNLLSNSMEVEFDNDKCNAGIIFNAVINAGYGASTSDGEPVTANEKNTALRDLILSFILLIVLMYVSMGHMINLPLPSFLEGHNNALGFAFTQFLIVLPILYIYRRYYIYIYIYNWIWIR